MSLTFDYVTMPPKSQEISQLQTNEMNKLQQENQQLAAQFQTQVKKSSEQTIRRNKAENEELKNEERRRQKQKKKKNNSGQSGDAEDSEEEKADAVPHFDMKV
ncbi:MAG: hypothetical protein HFH73_01395 [Lachnospiraceae bacterium]|jgi:hypothetical protein|nr:hypothetical protein [Lachnospiraceae bacterium]